MLNHRVLLLIALIIDLRSIVKDASTENWQGITPAERQRISERVLVEIDKYSAPPNRHANVLDIYNRLNLPPDVQSGVKKELETQGFIILVAAGVAQVTESGAAYAADLRAK